MFKSAFRFFAVALTAVVGLFAGNANAAAVDLSTLTAAVDFSTATTAVLGVAAALITVYIAWKAAKLVLNAVKGG